MKQKVTIEVIYEGTEGKITSVFDPVIPNLEKLDPLEMTAEQIGCVSAVGAVLQALQGDFDVEGIKREASSP